MCTRRLPIGIGAFALASFALSASGQSSSPSGDGPAAAALAGSPASDISQLAPAANAEAAPSAPENTAPHKLSLAAALAYAREHSPKLRAARARLEAVMLDADVADAAWLPRVGAFAELVGATANNSTTTLINQAVVDIPRVGATPTSDDYTLRPYASSALALGMRQQIYDFGKVAAERAAADLRSAIERYDGLNLGLDVELAVAESYYAVLAAAAIDAASESAFERASQHRDLARAAVQSGLRPAIELTRAEADVSRYEAGLEHAHGNVHVARSVFAAAIGADALELDADGELEPTAPLRPLATLLPQLSQSGYVRRDQARTAAQRAETARLEAQTRPTLFATAAISGRAGGAQPSSGPVPVGAGFLPVVPNYDFGVVLSWPLFDASWSRRAAASRMREKALALETDDTLRSLTATAQGAWHKASVAERALAALQRGADAARANYDQADHRFKVGLGTSTELADAQQLRTEAEIALAIGRFEIARTRAVLARALARAE